MQILDFSFPATRVITGRFHVGVVSSGDLEILMEASQSGFTTIHVCTSVSGYDSIWQATLERFFSRVDVQAHLEINDFGATPGMLLLRLRQAVTAMEEHHA